VYNLWTRQIKGSNEKVAQLIEDMAGSSYFDNERESSVYFGRYSFVEGLKKVTTLFL
jgi:hypothetical protein